MRLHIRLALTFGALLATIAIASGIWIANVAERYQAEVSQRLNAGVAMYVTNELPLIDHNGVNQQALKELAHRAMTVNPSVSVYLLAVDGTIMATLIPQEKIKAQTVNLEPIRLFLADAKRRPIYGDDPTDTQRANVFSVSPIISNGQLVGYLYVVLGSDRFESVTAALSGSYTLKMGAIAIAGLLLVSLVVSATAFAMLTLPLRRLAERMRLWAERIQPPERNLLSREPRGEIAMLNSLFTAMAGKIEQHVKDIQDRDTKRRELIANISHDLRTPLASLHGYIETVLMKSDQLPAATRRQYLETACRNSEQLQRLIAALFELSKLEAGGVIATFEAFSISELLQDVAIRFRLRAQQLSVEIETVADPMTPFVVGDISLIERVLENLLDNALRHTSAGGTVRLEGIVKGELIQVRVVDTGCGVASEDLPHLFERFYQGRRGLISAVEQGTGLGLAIVKRIVELHGHSVSIRNNDSKGTIVEFALTLSNPASLMMGQAMGQAMG